MAKGGCMEMEFELNNQEIDLSSIHDLSYYQNILDDISITKEQYKAFFHSSIFYQFFNFLAEHLLNLVGICFTVSFSIILIVTLSFWEATIISLISSLSFLGMVLFTSAFLPKNKKYNNKIKELYTKKINLRTKIFNHIKNDPSFIYSTLSYFEQNLAVLEEKEPDFIKQLKEHRHTIFGLKEELIQNYSSKSYDRVFNILLKMIDLPTLIEDRFNAFNQLREKENTKINFLANYDTFLKKHGLFKTTLEKRL